jgi:antitoxin HicB
MKKKKQHNYIGSSLDDFLKEEGILEHCEEVGAKYAFSMQLKDEMEKQNVTKEELAHRMHTSRSAVDRILDPNKPSTLKSFYKAAIAVGKPLRIILG